MESINREEWANSISMYINKYLESLYNSQVEYKANGESKEYKEYVLKNIELEKNLIDCIESMKFRNYLPYNNNNKNE